METKITARSCPRNVAFPLEPRTVRSIKWRIYEAAHFQGTNERGASSSLSLNQAKKDPSITTSHYFSRLPTNPSPARPCQGSLKRGRSKKRKGGQLLRIFNQPPNERLAYLLLALEAPGVPRGAPADTTLISPPCTLSFYPSFIRPLYRLHQHQRFVALAPASHPDRGNPTVISLQFYPEQIARPKFNFPIR